MDWALSISCKSNFIHFLYQDRSGAWLLMDARLGAGQPLAEAAALGRTFGSRQVGRMETVGCKDPGLVRRSLGCLAGALGGYSIEQFLARVLARKTDRDSILILRRV